MILRPLFGPWPKEGFECPNYLEVYAGGRVATRRATLAAQDQRKGSDEERYPGSPGWELGLGLTSSCKNYTVINPNCHLRTGSQLVMN